MTEPHAPKLRAWGDRAIPALCKPAAQTEPLTPAPMTSSLALSIFIPASAGWCNPLALRSAIPRSAVTLPRSIGGAVLNFYPLPFSLYPLLHFLNDHRRTVAKNLRRRPLTDHFRRVVVQAHHGIRTQFLGVLEEPIVGLLTRLLAHLGIRANFAANNVLEAAHNSLNNRRGSHNNSPNDASIFANSVSFNREGRRYWHCHWVSPLFVRFR